jgi:urease accessory protein
MTSAHALLSLMQLASPALPVGGFSYSEGLERAVEAGWVHDEASAATWLGDQLQLSLARSELPLMARAFIAWHEHDAKRLQALQDWALATRETQELRAQTVQMGHAMTQWLAHQHNDARWATLRALQPAPTWPVAFALAAVRSGATALDALLAFGFSWAENMVQAALKAVPLGQTAGQRVLAQLADRLPAAAQQALALRDDQRQAFAPALAIACAQHETQYTRLFRS